MIFDFCSGFKRGEPHLEIFCILLHIPLYFEALGCLCAVFDIIDSLYALLTCNMISILCKDLYFDFKVFLQLVHIFKFLRLFFLF